MNFLDLFRKPQSSPVPETEIAGGRKNSNLFDFIASILPQSSRTYEFTNSNLQQPTSPEIQTASAPLQQQTPYQHKIEIDTRDGKELVPSGLAQLLMEGFDDIGEATNAAKVLKHPYEQTYMPSEIERFGRESWNYGENPNYLPSKPDLQINGTWDRGLMRNNSFTYEDLLRNPYWARQIENAGINKFEDVDDLAKSIALARITLENSNWDTENQRIKEKPSWRRWFAAPLDLRDRE